MSTVPDSPPATTLAGNGPLSADPLPNGVPGGHVASTPTSGQVPPGAGTPPAGHASASAGAHPATTGGSGGVSGAGTTMGVGTMVQKLPTFDFQILPDHNQLTIYAGLNEASWGDVVSVGTSILDRLEQARTAKLLVDLSQLNYMGSSQVALLVRVWKVLKARDGQVAVQVKSDIVHKVLTIAGLHTLWDIVPTRAAAQRALGIRVTAEPRAVTRPAGSGDADNDADDETENDTVPQDVSPVLISLAVVFAAFLVLVLGQSHIWPGPSQIRLAVLMILSGVSVMCGVWSTTKIEGPLRNIGLGICLAGFVMGISAALEWPRSPLPPAAPRSQEESSTKAPAADEVPTPRTPTGE